jgi:hypothetical protein
MDRTGPIPTRASKGAVHQFGEHVAQHLGFTPGGALEPIVNLLGGKVQPVSPFEENGLGPPSIVVRGMRDFTIFLPTTTSPQRDRFTIAHELGHLFLHFPMVQRQKLGTAMVATRLVNESDTDQQRAEWEANWFAAAFLMKESAFAEVWRAARGGAAEVAVRFGVSEQAASIRARSLGLIAHG